MSDLYTKHELVALNTYLSYWPEGLTYAQVIERLNDDDLYRTDDDDDGINAGNDDIDPCGIYEDFDPAHIAEMIEDLRDTLARTYGGF